MKALIERKYKRQILMPDPIILALDAQQTVQFSSLLFCCRNDVNSEEEEEEEELSYSTLARDKRRRPRSRHASHHGGNRSIDLWRHDNAKAFPTLEVCLFVAGFQTVDVDTKLL